MQRRVVSIVGVITSIIVVTFLSGTPAALGFASGSPAQGTPFDSAANAARMIFEGMVVARDSFTPPGAASPSWLSIVDVARVLRSTPGAGPTSRQRVRVVSSTATEDATHAVFLTTGMSIDRDLTVRQLLRVPVSTVDDVLRVAARIALADSLALQRYVAMIGAEAAAVVLGVVESTTPIVIPDSILAYRSEHAPTWRQAVFFVRDAARQRDSSFVRRRIRVLYAESEDPEDEVAAHLASGDRRILLLRPLGALIPSQRLGIDTTGRYVVIRRRDALPAGDSALVWRALR